MPSVKPLKKKKKKKKSRTKEFPLWHNGISDISGTKGCRFNPQPSTVGLRIRTYGSSTRGWNCGSHLIPGLRAPYTIKRPKKKERKKSRNRSSLVVWRLGPGNFTTMAKFNHWSRNWESTSSLAVKKKKKKKIQNLLPATEWKRAWGGKVVEKNVGDQSGGYYWVRFRRSMMELRPHH